MLIQVVLIAAVAVGVLLLARGSGGARNNAVRRLALIAFAIVAVLAILFPDLTNTVAGWFGVGRGADLLLYALVVVFFYSMWRSARRSAATDRRVTLLARELALLTAEQETAANEQRDQGQGVHNQPDPQHRRGEGQLDHVMTGSLDEDGTAGMFGPDDIDRFAVHGGRPAIATQRLHHH